MPDRILTAGSAAAATFAAFIFFAGGTAAQAARCPLGEIYRPSRGVCVTREKAIEAGIYHGGSSAGAARTASLQSVAEAPPAPKPRPEALAAIERRAPAAQAKADDALAFTTARKPAAPAQPALVTPVVYAKPAQSPFGSLVALEPSP